MSKIYLTKQRGLILGVFKSSPSVSFDADEIYNMLQESGINKSTVYRNLDKLIKDDLIVRELSQDGSRNVFRFNTTHKCEGHLHLVCSKCSRTIHLDERDSDKMGSLINDNYGFEISDSQTVIKGVCKDCSK